MKTTHYMECWRDHHDCAIKKVEQLRDELLILRVKAHIALQAYEDGDSDELGKAMGRIEEGLK